MASHLYLALGRMVAVRGYRLAALSTPLGTRDLWDEAWRSPGLWRPFRVPAGLWSRISA